MNFVCHVSHGKGPYMVLVGGGDCGKGGTKSYLVTKSFSL